MMTRTVSTKFREGASCHARRPCGLRHSRAFSPPIHRIRSFHKRQRSVTPESAEHFSTRRGALAGERLPVARAFSRIFILPFSAMALLAGLLVFQIYQLVVDSRWVEHSDQVMLSAYDSLSTLLNLQADSAAIC